MTSFLDNVLKKYRKPLFGIGIGFGVFALLVLIGNFIINSNPSHEKQSSIVTPDVYLYTVIALTILASFLYICEKKNYLELKHVWELLTWFTIIIMPLTAVPSALEYGKHNPYLFFVAMIIVFISWVIIAVKFREPTFPDSKYYDRLLLVIPLYFLIMGLAVFWLMQSVIR